MASWSHIRSVLAATAIAAMLVPPAWSAWRLLTLPRPLAALPADYADRFAPLRPLLAGVPRVYYLNDYSATGATGAAPAAVARSAVEMFLAQRALAPTLVGLEPAAIHVLGNYRDRRRVPTDWRERGLELLADTGDGVLLWKLAGK